MNKNESEVVVNFEEAKENLNAESKQGIIAKIKQHPVASIGIGLGAAAGIVGIVLGVKAIKVSTAVEVAEAVAETIV